MRKQQHKKDPPTWPPDAWKPRRHGLLYCSPACGGGCTWKSYQQAKKESAALAKQLGPTWRPRVWENLGGWYWEAQHVGENNDHFRGDYRVFTVRRYTDSPTRNKYRASLSLLHTHFYTEGRTAKAAVERALADMQTYADKLAGYLVRFSQ